MHGSGRWAAPPNHPHGEMTFSLLLTYSQPGGSPRPHMSHYALQHGPHLRAWMRKEEQKASQRWRHKNQARSSLCCFSSTFCILL